MSPSLRRAFTWFILGGSLFIGGYLLGVAHGTRQGGRDGATGPRLPSPSTTGTPRLVFAHTSFDFREVPATDVVTHSFAFTNGGDATLEIREVRASCGCTAAGCSRRFVPPGGQAEVRATFRARGFQGRVRKAVHVFSNDPASPAELVFEGRVGPPDDEGQNH